MSYYYNCLLSVEWFVMDRPPRRITVRHRIAEPYEEIIRVAHIDEHIKTLTEMIYASPGKADKYRRRRDFVRAMLGYVEDEYEEKHAPITPLQIPQFVIDTAARDRPVTDTAAACGKLVIYALRPLHAVARVIFEHFRKECCAHDIYITVKGGVGCGIALIHTLLQRGELTRAKLLQIHTEFLSSDLDAAVMIRPQLPEQVFGELHDAVFGRAHKAMFDFRRDQLCIGGSFGDTVMADITPRFVLRGFAPLIAKEQPYRPRTGRGFRRAETLPDSFIAYTLSRRVSFKTALGEASFLLMRYVFPVTTATGIAKGELFDLAMPRRADAFLQRDFDRLYQGIPGARIFAITDLISEVLEER